jgi:hypothetical protein
MARLKTRMIPPGAIHPEGKWVVGNQLEATPEQLQKLKEMLKSRRGPFAYSLSELPPGSQGPPVELKLIWIRPSKQIPTDNPRASAITLPMTRAPDGCWVDLRFCIVLRQVNANTVMDKYGMPLPEEVFHKLRGAKHLAKIDLRRLGFRQLRLSAQQQAAFWWRNRLCTYTRLPFGHVNATALFQHVIEPELHNSGVTSAAVLLMMMWFGLTIWKISLQLLTNFLSLFSRLA